jgi:hypothetical protein
LLTKKISRSNEIIRSLRIVSTAAVLIPARGRGRKEIQRHCGFSGETCDFYCISKLWTLSPEHEIFGLKNLYNIIDNKIIIK